MKSLSQISKILNKHTKHRKRKTKEVRRVKVNFPWLKHSYSIYAKAFMAFIADNSPSIQRIKGEGNKRAFFKKKIYPLVKERFPRLYLKVKKYYRSKNSILTKEHFYKLLYARLLNMYGPNFFTKSSEHPTKSSNKRLRTAYCKLAINHGNLPEKKFLTQDQS